MQMCVEITVIRFTCALQEKSMVDVVKLCISVYKLIMYEKNKTRLHKGYFLEIYPLKKFCETFLSGGNALSNECDKRPFL